LRAIHITLLYFASTFLLLFLWYFFQKEEPLMEALPHTLFVAGLGAVIWHFAVAKGLMKKSESEA